MREFKYKTRFESFASCATDKEVDKYLAIASMKAIEKLLPKNIDFDKNYDLLGFAANGAVINRANKNSHIIDAKTAVAINKHFTYKPMDLAHSRANIVGTILNTGFTSFGSNEEMSEEDCLACDGPFNIALGGVVFRVANPNFAELLENSSNPDHLAYQSISASWELGFENYHILVGSPNLSEGEIVKAGTKEFNDLDKFLKINEGQNRLEDGTPLFMYIFGEGTQPLAYGFTTHPAAEVKGVITASEKDSKEKEKNIENNTESISHITNPIVINNDMKKNIKSLEEIYALNDEALKEVSASSIAEVIQNSIRTLSKDWEAKLTAEKNAGALAQKTADDLKSAVAELKGDIKSLSSAQASERAQAAFNTRMTLLDSEYNLDDADRTSIASDIKELDEEGFTKWYTSFAKYAKASKKTAKPDDKDGNDDDADDKDDKKKAEKAKAAKAEVLAAVEEALNTAKEKGLLVASSIEFGTNKMLEKYKDSFGIKGVTVKK